MVHTTRRRKRKYFKSLPAVMRIVVSRIMIMMVMFKKCKSLFE